MFPRYFVAEASKLRGSLVLLLVTSAPLLVMILSVVMAVHGDRAVPLDRFGLSATALWAFAMLPLTVTALGLLMAQMEHGPRTWDHLLALPGARHHLFAAKLAMMMALVAVMSGWLWVTLVAGTWLVAALQPTTGALDPIALGKMITLMAATSLLMCVIQLWAALRSRSFVPPLVLGILGTFVSVAAAGGREGTYFPWLMPLNMLASDPGMQRMALTLGVAGGAGAMLLMLVDLYSREA